MKLALLLLFLVFPAFSADVLAVLKEKIGSMKHSLKLKHSIIDNLKSNISGNKFLNVNVKNNYIYYGEKNDMSRFKEREDAAHYQVSKYEKEAMILGEKIQELETEVKNLGGELQDEKTGNQSNLMQKLDLANARGIKLEFECERFAAKMNILKQTLDEYAQKFEEELKKHNQTIQQLDDQLQESETLQKRIQQLKDERDAANDRLQRATLRELKKHDAIQLDLDSEIANGIKLHNYLEKCVVQIVQMEKQLKKNENATQMLLRQIENLVVDNHNLTVDNKNKDIIIQQVQDSNCELKVQINQMEEELKSLKQEQKKEKQLRDEKDERLEEQLMETSTKLYEEQVSGRKVKERLVKVEEEAEKNRSEILNLNLRASEGTLRSKGLKWRELYQIANEKNMVALRTIDPNAKTDDYCKTTALHFCAAHAWKGGVEYLMSCEPHLTVKESSGDQAFHWIGKWSEDPRDCLEVLQYFVQKGQDVNAIGDGGQSILIRFVAYKYTKAVEYLLKQEGIDLNIKLTKNLSVGPVEVYEAETAIDIARRTNANEIVEMIEKKTPVLCVTNNELQDPKRGVDTCYYLRYLSEDEFDKFREDGLRPFSTLHPETGKYIGYRETADTGEKLRFGERSEFKIEYNCKDNSFRLLSSKKDQERIQERILSWSQSVGTGYFMYKSGNKNWDASDKYTRFICNDADDSFSAKPFDGQTYQLGVYKCEGYTAIYREYNIGKRNTKFCFQKVNQ